MKHYKIILQGFEYPIFMSKDCPNISQLKITNELICGIEHQYTGYTFDFVLH